MREKDKPIEVPRPPVPEDAAEAEANRQIMSNRRAFKKGMAHHAKALSPAELELNRESVDRATETARNVKLYKKYLTYLDAKSLRPPTDPAEFRKRALQFPGISAEDIEAAERRRR